MTQMNNIFNNLIPFNLIPPNNYLDNTKDNNAFYNNQFNLYNNRNKFVILFLRMKYNKLYD